MLLFLVIIWSTGSNTPYRALYYSSPSADSPITSSMATAHRHARTLDEVPWIFLASVISPVQGWRNGKGPRLASLSRKSLTRHSRMTYGSPHLLEKAILRLKEAVIRVLTPEFLPMPQSTCIPPLAIASIRARLFSGKSWNHWLQMMTS